MSKPVPRIDAVRVSPFHGKGWTVDIVYSGGPYGKGRAYCETFRTRPAVKKFSKQFGLRLFIDGKEELTI